MNDVLISVIVPVYKAEAYLERCVDSIINQTYHNLEIILVNDGSPDSCGALCDEFAKKDSRIRVIHKENGGSSSARNAGLDIITGEYVGFVDSDDCIDACMYEHLYNLICTYNTEIAAIGIQTSCGNYFNLDFPKKADIEVYSQLDALKEVTRNQKITNSFCDKLWKADLLSAMRFPNGVLYEDMRIIHKVLECVEKIVYDPKPMYIYTVTGESNTRGVFHPRMFGEAYVAKERADYYYQKHPEAYEYAIAEYIRVSLMRIWWSRKTPSCRDMRIDLIREMREDFSQGAINLLNYKNKIKLYSLRMGIPCFNCVMMLNNYVTVIKKCVQKVRSRR